MSYWSQWDKNEIRSEQGYEERENDSLDNECESDSEEEEEFYCSRCCDSGCNSCFMLEY